MKGELHISPETEIRFSESTLQDVHLEDLSFILDVDVDDGEVTSCVIDLTKLVQAMTLYSSMEVFEYDWRAFGKKGATFDPTDGDVDAPEDAGEGSAAPDPSE